MDKAADSYRRFLDGDEQAFEDIMKELFRGLVFFIDGFVRDPHTAEDIAIDVFSDLIVHKHRFNFKVAQDFDFRVAGRKNTIQVGLDINNLGNLLNSNWGTYDRLSGDQLLNYDAKTSTYEFTAPTWSKLTTVASTWEMLLSLRWFF